MSVTNPHLKLFYFYKSTNIQIGNMLAYSFVYFGSLLRHQYHGMQRIDYSIYLEYDNKPCKYCWHKVTMYIMRTLLLICFLIPYIILNVYTTQYEKELMGYYNMVPIIIMSVFRVCFTCFIAFFYFEKLCFEMKMDIN